MFIHYGEHLVSRLIDKNNERFQEIIRRFVQNHQYLKEFLLTFFESQ